MCYESQRLEKQIKHLESQIHELPEGKLICAQNDNRWKWYHSDGHKSVYIPKKEQLFAEKLATKKYLSLLSEDLRQEKGISQLALANAIGVSQKAIDYWERGVNQPKASYIVLLADFFDVSCDYLLGRQK